MCWSYCLNKFDCHRAFQDGSSPFPGLEESRGMEIRTWNVDLRPQIADDASTDENLGGVILPPVAQAGDWSLMHIRGRTVSKLDS